VLSEEAPLAIRVRQLEDALDESTPADSAVSAEQLEEVVHQINGICRSSSLEFALRVGAVIIHHFYGGATEAWRHRGPKANSFRRLAEHPELALSPGALYRCVAIFEMCERLRAASRWRRLGASHLRTVIGIPADKQEYLLNKANEERWSVQTLQAQAQRLRMGCSRGGRRARSPLGKQLSVLERCLQDCQLALDSVGENQLDELERTLAMCEKMKASVEALAGTFESRRRQLLSGSGPVGAVSSAGAPDAVPGGEARGRSPFRPDPGEVGSPERRVGSKSTRPSVAAIPARN
jgi:hypothetical protein